MQTSAIEFPPDGERNPPTTPATDCGNSHGNPKAGATIRPVGKPLRASELRKCDVCGQPLNHLIFYTVTLEQHGIKLDEARRAAGLEMMLGPLAPHMGPDQEITQVLQTRQLILCSACFTDTDKCIAELL
jgi:hypothetical protein